MKGWMKGSAAALLTVMVCGNAYAQETGESPEPTRLATQSVTQDAPRLAPRARVTVAPVNLNPEKPDFVPILRERKMTETEYFAYQHGLPLDSDLLGQGPAYADAGARSVGPDGAAADSRAPGTPVATDTLRRMDRDALRAFVQEHRANVEALRTEMEHELIALRAATEEDFDQRLAKGRPYEQLRDNVERLANEIANLEAAYVELEEFDKLETLEDMEARMKRALVHLRTMKTARDIQEFDDSAAVLATALGIIELQREELAAK